MAIVLVTYDLRQPGRDYKSVHDYLKKFTYCKGLESVWLLDTTVSTSTIRDALNKLIDDNDKTFVVKISKDWSSHAFGCAEWLNQDGRNW